MSFSWLSLAQRTDYQVQLWSETYDRDLDDIFAVQEDIARSVAQVRVSWTAPDLDTSEEWFEL